MRQRTTEQNENRKILSFSTIGKKESRAIETIPTFLTMGMLSSCNSFVCFVFTLRPDNAHRHLSRIHRILCRSLVTIKCWRYIVRRIFLRIPPDKLFGIIYMTFPFFPQFYYRIIVVIGWTYFQRFVSTYNLFGAVKKKKNNSKI